MPNPSSTIARARLLLRHGWLVVLLAAILPYVPSLDGEFVFDDLGLIVQDPSYERATAWDCWRRTFWPEERSQGLYRPLTTFSYWLNIRLAGRRAPAFRTLNLALHGMVSLALLALLRRLRLGAAVATAAAVIYAVHPLHVEAVVPAFGRAELLCALFVLAGLLAHAWSRERPLANLAAGLCVLLAFWAKESGIVLVPLCLACDLVLRRGGKRGRRLDAASWRAYGVYLLCLLPAAFSRVWVTGGFFPHMRHFDALRDNVLALVDPLTRTVTAIRLQGLALVRFLWPATLSHDYSYAQVLPAESVLDAGFLATVALVPLACAAMLVLQPRRRRAILAMLALYGLSVLPTANLLTPTGTIFAERLLYLPSAWLCVLLAFVLRDLARGHGRALLLLVGLVALALAARTVVRGGDWRSQTTLALKGVETAPRSCKTWNNLAVELARAGQSEEAILAATRSLEIHPGNRLAWENRGLYQINLGRWEDARRDLGQAVALGARRPDVLNRLGAVHALLGEPEEACRRWRESLRIDPRQDAILASLRELEEQAAASPAP